MKKLSRTRKIILASFFGILALLCFHPVGIFIVKSILPLGVGITDLIGTAFGVLFVLVVLDPRGFFIRHFSGRKTKKQKLKEISTTNSTVQNFIFELVKRDNDSVYIPYFMTVIDVATKRNKIRILESFINYYGILTLKLLDSREELMKNLVSQEIKETVLKIQEALNDIQEICVNFRAKILSDDLIDVDADIQVLGIISNTDNLL